MTKTIFSGLALVLSIGLAQAQDVERNDAAKAAHAPGGPGGTVGAMESFSYGIATSAQDVVLQQQGMTTAAGGGRPLQGRSVIEVTAYAPGTVGATPGSASGR